MYSHCTAVHISLAVMCSLFNALNLASVKEPLGTFLTIQSNGTLFYLGSKSCLVVTGSHTQSQSATLPPHETLCLLAAAINQLTLTAIFLLSFLAF